MKTTITVREFDTDGNCLKETVTETETPAADDWRTHYQWYPNTIKPWNYPLPYTWS